MPQKYIYAALKKGDTVSTEEMDEERAKAELDRINGELNNAAGPQFIKLGDGATVSREDVSYVALGEYGGASSGFVEGDVPDRF